MSARRFKTTIASSGNRVYLAIPFNPDDIWGGKSKHHIRGVVNGHMVRGPIGFDGQQYYLTLGPTWRRDTGLEIGAEVEVEIAPEGPQADQLADDITQALEAEPQAKMFFKGLATFYRNNYLRWIEGARRPETRAERIREMVQLLTAGRKQR